MAEDDNPEMEEVVVTGSYLKRTAADSPSPLSVVTSADIEDIGAADVAEVIASFLIIFAVGPYETSIIRTILLGVP